MGKEEYREMFSRLHTSIDEEAIIMDPKRQGKPRIAALVLAAVLVLALAVGAAAVWQHRFQDLIVLGTRTPSPDATPQIVDPEDPRPAQEDIHLHGFSSLSLQGFAGSPEFEAAKEWAEFLDGYDRDREIWNAVNENGSPPAAFMEEYLSNQYYLYSQEMADELHRIAEKYGLALHTGGSVSVTIPELEERVGDFLFLPITKLGGTYLADGTFNAVCRTDDGEQDYILTRCMKGVLGTWTIHVRDAENFEQWTYRTACGVTVLICLSEETGWIVADLEQSFVTVRVLLDSQYPDPITGEQLQTIADSIDFSIL